MIYSIEFKKDALKYLQKLDKPTRARIVHHLQILCEIHITPSLTSRECKALLKIIA